MNDSERTGADWQALGETWRRQSFPEVDIAALRSEIARRSRGLAIWRIFELVTAAVSSGICMFAMLWPGPGLAERGVYFLLLIVVVGFTWWTHVQRRRQWRATDLAAPALVRFEIARVRTSLRVWRVSTWIVFTLWCALYAAAFVNVMFHAPDQRQLLVWGLNLAANAPVVLASAFWAWWAGRRSHALLSRLHALKAALAEE